MRRKKIFVFILLAIATLLVCQYIVGWPLKRLALSAAPALVLFWRLFFVILWSVFLFWLLMPYLAAGRNRRLAVGLGLAVVGLLFVALSPYSWRQEIQGYAGRGFQTSTRLAGPTAASVKPAAAALKTTPARQWSHAAKYGHFFVFAFIGLCLALSPTAIDKRLLLLDCMLLAGASEMVQFFIQGRQPLVGDWLIDMAGAVLGVFLSEALGVRSKE
ncbi:MAG: hypothetical protein A2521_01250 [Deltaproteobacteria bacterium RIFOXYD12_FULL_57_12]|nr:MAG: hypothetical protein A2521_01250 [Deltaproteobacteria bacterium RIFOXYD12_FULL_57_12]